ncbi:hypothetical protein LBMAG42_09530 [Deltaproteobacteria bacterium]|nr:hypothetical protein LBMAG42_09530 [Deltaproteobacteria bacterium]
MYGVPVNPRILPLLWLSALACEQDYQVVATPPDVDPADVTECGFTRVENTAFYRYDCNPVFTSTEEDWLDVIGSTAFNVTEVAGHPMYQVWYSGLIDDGSQFPPYSMGYAVSADGTDFTPYAKNPVMDQGGESSFDADYMSGNQVVWDPESEQYVMIWQGIDDEVNPNQIVNGLGVGTSSDGTKWTRFAKNPVFDFGSGASAISYCWPLDLTLGDVSGYTGYVAGGTGRDSECGIYRLNASSLGEWKAAEEPVLDVGERGAWDAQGMTAMSIAQLAGQKYMFYVGFGSWTQAGNYILATNPLLGMATYDAHSDTWERSDDDPVPVNNTATGDVGGVEALTVGTRIHLWITDQYGEGDDAVTGIGYFLFDPIAAEAEDAGGE